jgi:hypothetical protein
MQHIVEANCRHDFVLKRPLISIQGRLRHKSHLHGWNCTDCVDLYVCTFDGFHVYKPFATRLRLAVLFCSAKTTSLELLTYIWSVLTFVVNICSFMFINVF